MPASTEAKKETIMCCVDDSLHARTTLEKAFKWAYNNKNIEKVLIVYTIKLPLPVPVIGGPVLIVPYTSIMHSQDCGIATVHKSMKAAGHRVLEKFRSNWMDMEKAAGVKETVPFHAVLVSSQLLNPAEAAVQYADQEHPTLIMVGTRHLNKFKKFFLGSFSEHMVRHAKQDVLVVVGKEGDDEKKEAEKKTSADTPVDATKHIHHHADKDTHACNCTKPEQEAADKA